MEFRKKNNWEDLKEKHRDKMWGIKEEKDENSFGNYRHLSKWKKGNVSDHIAW